MIKWLLLWCWLPFHASTQRTACMSKQHPTWKNGNKFKKRGTVINIRQKPQHALQFEQFWFGLQIREFCCFQQLVFRYDWKVFESLVKQQWLITAREKSCWRRTLLLLGLAQLCIKFIYFPSFLIAWVLRLVWVCSFFPPRTQSPHTPNTWPTSHFCRTFDIISPSCGNRRNFPSSSSRPLVS